MLKIIDGVLRHEGMETEYFLVIEVTPLKEPMADF